MQKTSMIKVEDEVEHSSSIHLSYALGSFLNDFIATSLGMWVFKFYETEIFLPVGLISIVVVIYGLWNAINDPLAGHVSDRPLRFTERWGKRFSWFMMTAIPTCLIFFFIFTPPIGSPDLIIFLWALASLCLLDTLASFYGINWQALYPDKFRSHKERTKVGGFQVICSLIGLSIGLTIPILLITTGPPGTNIPSYVLTALIITMICIVIIILMIPGMREDDEMIERSLQQERIKKERKQEEKGVYLKKLKIAFKNKNFLSYLIAYLGQSVVMALIISSLPYWTQYVVDIELNLQVVILLGFLMSTLVSVPFWIKVSRRFGNRIGYICGTGFSFLFLIIATFQTEIIGVLLSLILIGFSMGATWSLLYPCFSDVIDEVIIKTGERSDGIYYGFRTFMGRLGIVVQGLTFGIIHTITGFDPHSTVQTPLAQFGISFGMFFVPAIFYFIGFLCMWRIYDLKPNKVLQYKNELKSRNL